MMLVGWATVGDGGPASYDPGPAPQSPRRPGTHLVPALAPTQSGPTAFQRRTLPGRVQLCRDLSLQHGRVDQEEEEEVVGDLPPTCALRRAWSTHGGDHFYPLPACLLACVPLCGSIMHPERDDSHSEKCCSSI